MDTIAVPTTNRATVLRRDELVAAIRRMVSVGRVIDDEQGRGVYAADAFGGHAALPLAVVLPGNIREIVQVLRYCYESGLKVFPRGAGTSLTGGAVGSPDGIVLCLSLMNRVLEIDPANRLVRVEAGISTAAVSAAAVGKGLRYTPDPSSRSISTIGGNIATNAGGARALRFGATAQSVLALKLVLIDGELIELGGGELEASAFDLIGIMTGSEGMLGIVVEATLRLVPVAPARGLILLGFQSMSAALDCAKHFATTMVLTAVEVYDRRVVAVCDEFGRAGLPHDIEALLVVEIEGGTDEIAAFSQSVLTGAERFGPTVQFGVSDIAHIDRIWRALDSALTALGRLAAVRCVDIAVAPSRLPETLSRIHDIAAQHSLDCASMCRAIEGIVRSVFLYDDASQEAAAGVTKAIADVSQLTHEIDGVLAGEHGIGVAKRDALVYQLTAHDLALQMRLKSAFDTEWLLSNGKVYPFAEHVGPATA